MEVTRDIARDLIPAVVSGEASGDARAAVEEWSRRDAGLAAEAESLRSALASLAAAPRPVPRAAAEDEAVRRVRRRLRRRSVLLGVAIFLTALPFTFGYGPGGLSYLMLRDNPALAGAAVVAAAACWTALAAWGRRVARSG
jgi:anti-sigma factor RsiW